MKQRIIAACIAALCLLPAMPASAAGRNGFSTIVAAQPAGVAAGDWQQLRRMPGARVLAAAAAIDGIIYVAGGINSSPDKSLMGYDVATRAWTVLADLPENRYSGDGAAVIGGQLYVAGGWTRYPPYPHSSLYVYDPSSNTWSKKASMSHRSACGATGAIGGKLYVLTACDGYNGYSSEFDVYDPATDGWTALSSPSNAHANPAFGVVGGMLVVAGGLDANGNLEATTEAYDPGANSWTTLAPEPQPATGPASAADAGLLIVAGGNNGTAPIANVQVLDIGTNSWTTGTALPSAIANAEATAYDGFVYIEGGSTEGGNVRTNLRCRARVCGGR